MKYITFCQQFFFCILIYWIMVSVIQTAMAEDIEIAPDALENMGLNYATNGAPIIDIATPNNEGLSHNRYNHFNVGSKGIILNNSVADQTSTQLAGMIEKNPHLMDNTARLIINEVVAPNPSALMGIVEVAGAAANVVVANPYGIICDGCHFINTPKVSLFAISDYPISEFVPNRNNGKITIQGKGIDARNNDYLQLLSHTIAVNAQIQAKKLGILTDPTEEVSNKLIEKELDKISANNNVPILSIDIGDLGGMYADHIFLISGRQGVGVNLKNMETVSGNIQINVNGLLTLNNAASQQDINVTANQLHVTGIYTANNNISLKSRDAIQLEDAILTAGKQLTIQANGQFTSYASNLTADIMKIQSENISQDNSSRFTAGELSISGKQLDFFGELQGYHHLDVKGAFLQGRDSAVFESGHSMSIMVSSDSVWSGKMWAGEELAFSTSAQLDNHGSLLGPKISLSANRLINRQWSYINTDHLKVTGDLFHNYGRVNVFGELDFTELKNLTMQGDISRSDFKPVPL